MFLVSTLFDYPDQILIKTITYGSAHVQSIASTITYLFFLSLQVLGTPTEEDWPGVTRLPGYKLNKLGQYKPRKLGLCWPRLHDVVQGEAMASALLQLNPQNRLDAEEAMHHPYFNGLPKKCLELPDGKIMKANFF